jgi:hypothetical protein
VGASLAVGKPLLLIQIVRSGPKKGPCRSRLGPFSGFKPMEPCPFFIQRLLERRAIVDLQETIFGPMT